MARKIYNQSDIKNMLIREMLSIKAENILGVDTSRDIVLGVEKLTIVISLKKTEIWERESIPVYKEPTYMDSSGNVDFSECIKVEEDVLGDWKL